PALESRTTEGVRHEVPIRRVLLAVLPEKHRPHVRAHARLIDVRREALLVLEYGKRLVAAKHGRVAVADRAPDLDRTALPALAPLRIRIADPHLELREAREELLFVRHARGLSRRWSLPKLGSARPPGYEGTCRPRRLRRPSRRRRRVPG